MSVEDCKNFMQAFLSARDIPRAILLPQWSIIADLDGHPVCIYGRISIGSTSYKMNIHPKDNKYMNILQDLADKGVGVIGITKPLGDKTEFKFMKI